MSTKLNGSKYWYVVLTIHLNTSPLLHTVKRGKSSTLNNSISHKSFIYTQFKCQTILYTLKSQKQFHFKEFH